LAASGLTIRFSSNNAASPRFGSKDFFAVIADFFPSRTDFCAMTVSTFIASSDGNYGMALT
jgi:hypothetical protein